MPRRTPEAQPAAFVRAWQTSKTVEEAAERLGMTVHGAYERARRYRGKGIPLIAHGGELGIDVEGLKALATSLRRIS